MEVKRGELVVLLGANGAGKSTIFRTISGLTKPSYGEITFLDKKISGWSPNRIVMLGVVQCAEGRKLFPGMTVFENLKMGGFVHRQNKRELKALFPYVFDLFPILREKKDQPAGSLSGGQQQMLAIARALMAKPKLLLLDEPSLGLAPLIVKQLFDIIQRINQEGTTVLLAEQNASAALKIADRGYVIESGEIVIEGSSETLLNHDQIRKAYIGA
ncbi:amino acid/amide ABC transporter ATP-binding protein 2 (HAAT family) [Melghirimyces profundicolus]|uniref:Amino acid/amide ABC transporter ATP-binding protein 2 (HAAT family) n=2 Tax=Melghirimyces profundicolus TaxID=1242148 RepID=A0A2T6BGH0_9BACL|nr:amino acid/amide ABC transporter ATP-binding protein 2 (HAAT family) [Melghirimyces profundicolus]